MPAVTTANLVVIIAVLVSAIGSALVEPFINNPLKRSFGFRWHRFLVWICIGVSYSGVYFGRYNLVVLNVEEIRGGRLGLSTVDFGWIVTCGYLSYTAFMILNGYITDKWKSHISAFLYMGVGGSGLMNLVIALLLGQESLKDWYLGILLVATVLNYYFQAFATSVFVKVNAKWFHYRERGLFGGLFNVITSSGYFLSLTVGGLVVSRLPVEWVFYMPAMLLLAMVLFNFFFVKATPADAGFLKEDEENNEAAYKDNSDQETKAEVSFLQLLRWMVTTPRVLLVLVVYGEMGMVKDGVLVWFSAYVETFGVIQDSMFYLILSTGIFFGGVVGSVLCGWISDRFFVSKREPVMLIFHVIMLGCLIVLSVWDTQLGAAGVVVVLIVISTLMFGIVGMLNFASIADIGCPNMVATIAAMLTGVSYVCSSFAGVAMGWLIQNYGFLPWKLMLVGSAGVGVCCMALLVVLLRACAWGNNNNSKEDLRKDHQQIDSPHHKGKIYGSDSERDRGGVPAGEPGHPNYNTVANYHNELLQLKAIYLGSDTDSDSSSEESEPLLGHNMKSMV